jgi:hypothetical protein
MLVDDRELFRSVGVRNAADMSKNEDLRRQVVLLELGFIGQQLE